MIRSLRWAGGVEHIDGIEYKLSYRYIETDAGKDRSKRPKQKNDCTVRAIALAFNLPYDEAYDLLSEYGRKCNEKINIDNLLKNKGCTLISFPAVKGQRRMNPHTFCTKYNEGIYICRVAKHVFTVINGILYDSFPSTGWRCIYQVWKIN